MKRKERHNTTLQSKQGIATPATIYCAASLISLVILFIFFILSHGELISRYFWEDTRDTGMDFFHSIEYVRGRAPYELYNTLYPPLANLFFYLLYLMVPKEVSSAWSPTYEGGILARGTNIDLRTYQAPMILFILFVVISCWMLLSMIRVILENESFGSANRTAICLLLCPGCLCALERGNILLITIPMVLFFLKYRNSDNKVIGELSLLSLAAAAGLKLYPAFFGILLLRDKQYGRAVRAVIYGILSVILPALVFQEGLMGIPMWLSVVFRFGDTQTLPYVGTGLFNILHRVAYYFQKYLGIELYTGWFEAAAVIVSVILLVCALFLKKDWQSALAITMAIILFQSQGDYIYAYLLIPLVFFFAEEPQFSRETFIPFVLMVGLMIHLPLFFRNNPNMVFRQADSLLLACWCVIHSICTIYHTNTEKKKQEAP